jgi:archaellum component FlaC
MVNQIKMLKEKIEGINQSKLVPLLTKAIQEQQAQIETLKQEIQELKE